MAKKKRKAKQTLNAVSGIRYNGEVKVSIMKGDKALSTKVFHNTGYKNLFKFMCNSLAGNYVTNDVPCKIALYTAVNTAEDTPTSPKFDSSLIQTIGAILMDTAAVVNSESSDALGEYYSVTYHFSVPYAYIKGNGTVKLYKAGLFKSDCNTEYTTYKDELCATDLFINDSNEWDPIQISKATDVGNFSIAIEWKLSVHN